MKVLGIDASSSKCGVALIADGELEMAGCWKPPEKQPQIERMMAWGEHIASLIAFGRPDMVVVEECAPHRNMNTVRALLRFETIPVYEAKRAGKIVLLFRVSEARKIVLGDGATKKDEVFRQIKARYPQVAWPAVDKGGDDIADAILGALAAPRLAERR